MNTKLILLISIFLMIYSISSVCALENTTCLEDGDANASALNTRIVCDDISAEEGDAVYFSADILDENENPVMNGSATLSLGGRNYESEVLNGTVSFPGIEIKKGMKQGVIYYHGNEYYKDSSRTVDVYLIEESYMKIPIYDDDSDIDAPQKEIRSQRQIDAVKAIEDSRSTGNPIFLVLLCLFAITSSLIFKRKG